MAVRTFVYVNAILQRNASINWTKIYFDITYIYLKCDVGESIHL